MTPGSSPLSVRDEHVVKPPAPSRYLLDFCLAFAAPRRSRGKTEAMIRKSRSKFEALLQRDSIVTVLSRDRRGDDSRRSDIRAGRTA
jgi:hypothetical protein